MSIEPKPYPNTQNIAIGLCVCLEAIAPRFYLHVGLTGGCLYKTGTRKDIDIVLYRVRQEPVPNLVGFWKYIKDELGFTFIKDCGYVQKWTKGDLNIDFMYPEHIDVIKPTSFTASTWG